MVVRYFIVGFILLISLSISGADKLKLNFLTGPEGGTYNYIGKEIKNSVQKDVDIEIINSQGAIDNLVKLLKEDKIGFTIVQEDSLNYFKINRRNSLKMVKKFYPDAKPENFEKLLKELRVVIPLYPEEIHIVVKKSGDIKKIEDLEGKKVSFGQEASGSRVTGAIIFHFAKVDIKRVYSKNSEAIEKVLSGEIDGAIFIGGAPLKFLEDLPKDSDLSILSIQSDKLKGLYKGSTIKGYTYPWLKDDIKTYSTHSIMVARKTDTSLVCAARKRVIENILKNIKKFKNYGHKKWEKVDLNLKVKNWEVEECVKPILRGGEKKGESEKIN